MMKWICAIVLNGLILQSVALANDISLRIGIHNIRAKVANKPLSRQNGLKNNTQLCGNCGMIFVFPTAGKYKFWMKDTPLPLSIAFINANGRILKIDDMQANTLSLHSAKDDVLYALEMKKGWFAENAIKVHTYVHGLKSSPLGE